MTTPTTLPTPLTDLAVQDGSIVSRILLKTGGGSVTLFAFARGEGLSEHSTPREALLAVTDGEAEVTLDGETHTVASGEAIRLPASVPHAVHAPVDFRMLLVTLTA